jgi:hypothetical protein
MYNYLYFCFLKDYFNTTDPLHARNSIFTSWDATSRHWFFQLIILMRLIILNIKNIRFIIKLVKFHITSGVVTKLFLSVKKGGLIHLKY